jgi:hypothetical protein
MAAIPESDTTKVPAERAVAAVPNGTRRARPSETAAQVADRVAPAGSAAAALASKPQPALDDAALARVLESLGYGNTDPSANLVAHDDDEGSLIEFTDSGVIRFPAPLPHRPDTPRRYRLRPPLFGELKLLRGKLADAGEAIDEATIVRQEAKTAAAATQAEAEKQPAGPERSKAMLDVKRRYRAADEAFDLAAEEALADWWRQVFETLQLDGVPEEWGSWLLDQQLALDVINSWRASPRRPGR